jgi:IclR family pca regulon transcriptional regulator
VSRDMSKTPAGAAEPENDREFVAGLARGMNVLEAFNEADREMTLSEVARRTSMSPAAVRRSLRTLAKLGYIRNIDRRYLLSARVLSLGSAYLRSADVEGTLMPELLRLVGIFGDTAGIAVLVDTNILYVAHYCAPRGIRPVAGSGVTYPAYPTSLGRVLLAGLAEPELHRYFATARFDKHTTFTETNPKRLHAILDKVRKAGFGTVVDQLFYGVTSLSVPILSPTGTLVAALNTSAYTGQTSADQLIATRLRELQKSAKHLAQIFAHHPALLKSLQTAPDRESGAPRREPRLSTSSTASSRIHRLAREGEANG